MDSLENTFNCQRYGSHDSTDTDIVLFLESYEMPKEVEDRKRLVNRIKKEFDVDYNIMLAVVKDGIIVDCMVPSSVDSLNNAVFTTYSNFEQTRKNNVTRRVNRNVPLAYYRTLHTIMSYLCRTQYRTEIRPIMHYSVDVIKKLEAIDKVDFTSIVSFNQKNVNDVDVWKKLAFYVVQQTALSQNIEIYDKISAKEFEPKCINFINRKELNLADKIWIDAYIKKFANHFWRKWIVHNNELLSFDNQWCNIKTFTTTQQ